ncbi:MAG: isoprenylcysteine carboxylmethyltransferase family protein [Chloroflexota bacterium]
MSEQAKGTSSDSNLKSSKRVVVLRFALGYIILGSMFFLPAWTFGYWQAWVYMLMLSVPMVFLIRYLYKHDPKLLERRMRMKEKQKTQKVIVAVSWLFFLPAFIVPGFDHRLHWSNVPLTVIIISDVLVLFGYFIVALVFKTNSYASRIIEVEKGQKVITTGPYAIVRHPMYFGVLILYIFSPLALGSYWAVIPALLIIPLLVARIMGEEKELQENLEGYREYTMKTKYRLLPGLW